MTGNLTETQVTSYARLLNTGHAYTFWLTGEERGRKLMVADTEPGVLVGRGILNDAIFIDGQADRLASPETKTRDDILGDERYVSLAAISEVKPLGDVEAVLADWNDTVANGEAAD